MLRNFGEINRKGSKEALLLLLLFFILMLLSPVFIVYNAPKKSPAVTIRRCVILQAVNTV